MCGISGFISRETSAKFNKGRILFQDMLLDNRKRGDQGTGVFLKDKDDVLYHKSAYWSPDFINLAPYAKTLAPRLGSARFAVGHNRAATKGNISHENSHPFSHKHIILCHNGYISNAWQVTPRDVNHQVDSFAAAWAIAEKGEKEGLEQLEGPFALVWYNNTDNSLNMARNDGRELWLMFGADDKGEAMDVMYFMSEWHMLYHLMRHHDLKFGSKFKLLPQGQHVKFDLNKPVREYTRVPFVSPSRSQSSTATAGAHTQQATAGAAATSPQTNPSGDQNKSVNGSEDTNGSSISVAPPARRESKSSAKYWRNAAKDVPEALLDGLYQRFEALSKRDKGLAGIPGTRKKLRTAIAKLLHTPNPVGKSILAYPDNWHPYKNQRDRGTILGSKYADLDVLVEIGNVSRDIFSTCRKYKGVYATVVNSRRSKTGKTVLTCILDPGWGRGLAPSGPTLNTDDDNVVAILKGPGGSMVERAKWVQLTKDGCCYCSRTLDPERAADVIWVHSKDPLCHECSDSGKILVELGLAHPSILAATEDEPIVH